MTDLPDPRAVQRNTAAPVETARQIADRNLTTALANTATRSADFGMWVLVATICHQIICAIDSEHETRNRLATTDGHHRNGPTVAAARRWLELRDRHGIEDHRDVDVLSYVTDHGGDEHLLTAGHIRTLLAEHDAYRTEATARQSPPQPQQGSQPGFVLDDHVEFHVSFNFPGFPGYRVLEVAERVLRNAERLGGKWDYVVDDFTVTRGTINGAPWTEPDTPPRPKGSTTVEDLEAALASGLNTYRALDATIEELCGLQDFIDDLRELQSDTRHAMRGIQHLRDRRNQEQEPDEP